MWVCFSLIIKHLILNCKFGFCKINFLAKRFGGFKKSATFAPSIETVSVLASPISTLKKVKDSAPCSGAVGVL